MEEFPEPHGCHNLPGFVKSNPLNNESYLDKCCEAYPFWEDILRETHAKLENLVPGYNIAQIKEKFGGLRYYIDMPKEWYGVEIPDELYEQRMSDRDEAYAIASNAENTAVNINLGV